MQKIYDFTQKLTAETIPGKNKRNHLNKKFK